ncbi:hypothetical protein BZZ01_29090 [Nostocales cyanobacterium HT-58-2]|nr:hypothetical protein BZZ01_29090 [Nostocales cyanobacterium HT-58-2]
MYAHIGAKTRQKAYSFEKFFLSTRASHLPYGREIPNLEFSPTSIVVSVVSRTATEDLLWCISHVFI